MKISTLAVVCLFILSPVAISSCPTCASSLDDYTPPFFSEEFYAPRQEKKSVQKQELKIREGEDDEEETDTVTTDNNDNQ